MNTIEVRNLQRRFGRTEAISNLTLNVPEGSVYALLGANGAGKTTTIKILMNLLAPTAGKATVLGVDSRKLGSAERAQIGYVSENQQLPLWMTVRQFLDYCGAFYPTWDGDLERRLLRKFELPEERRLRHLSRGMLMKTGLLACLPFRPKLLVLDEPFSGLDPLVRDEFVQGILESADADGWTVFISSHDVDEVERLADHVGFIEHGQTRINEPSETLLSRYRRIEVNLQGNGAELRNLPPEWEGAERADDRVTFVDRGYSPERTAALCRKHFGVAQVTAHPMTLREIFLTLARTKMTASQGGAS